MSSLTDKYPNAEELNLQVQSYYTPYQPYILATEVLEELEKRLGSGKQYTTFPNKISDEEKAKVEAAGYIVTRNTINAKNLDGSGDMYIGFQVAVNETAASGDRLMVISQEETNGIEGGGGGGGDSYSKAEIDQMMLGKVDKVEGKGLSTNDYTDSDKTKVDASQSATDVTNAIEASQTAQEQSLIPITDSEVETMWHDGEITVSQVDSQGQYYLTQYFETLDQALARVSQVPVGRTWSMHIGDSVTEAIPDNMLKDNAYVSEVYVGKSVTSIGQYAFSAMTSLKRLHVYAAVSEIPSGLAYNSTALEDCILDKGTVLNSGCLASTTSMTSLQLPTNLTTIKGGALSNIGVIELNFMGTTIASIENGAVYSSTLTTVRLPSTITTIAPSGFAGCSGVTVYIKKQTDIDNSPWGISNATVIYDRT